MDPQSSQSELTFFTELVLFTSLLTRPLTAPNISPSTYNTSNGLSLSGGFSADRSLINVYIAVSDDQLRLFCFVLGQSEDAFSVKIERDRIIDDLMETIFNKIKLKDIRLDRVKLFKVIFNHP